MIDSPLMLAARALGREYHLDGDGIQWQLERLSKPLDEGRITLRTFTQRLSAATGVKISYPYFRKLLLDSSLRKATSVWNSVALLKIQGNFDIVALSNMSKPMWEALQTKYNIESLFDRAVLSCEHGILKPDLRIFRLAIREASAQPSVSLLLDDLPANTEAARSLGMQTHLATSQTSTSRFLESLMQSTRAR